MPNLLSPFGEPSSRSGKQQVKRADNVAHPMLLIEAASDHPSGSGTTESGRATTVDTDV